MPAFQRLWQDIQQGRLYNSMFPSSGDHRVSVTFNDNSRGVFLREHFQKCCAVTSTGLSSPETNHKMVMKNYYRDKAGTSEINNLSQETSWTEIRGGTNSVPSSPEFFRDTVNWTITCPSEAEFYQHLSYAISKAPGELLLLAWVEWLIY